MVCISIEISEQFFEKHDINEYLYYHLYHFSKFRLDMALAFFMIYVCQGICHITKVFLPIGKVHVT